MPIEPRDANAPNFFVIGAAKCGTSTLYGIIKQHPDIFLSEDKEPHFFDSDEYYNKGIDFYLKQHFSGAEGYSLRGEATPSYLTQSDTVPQRIQQHFGDNLKFIVIMRDPAKRAWSHYLHTVRIGRETLAFEEALRLEEKRVEEGKLAWIRYFGDGLYAHHLTKWFEVYPKNRFIFVLTDDLKQNAAGVAADIFESLGISDFVVDTMHIANPAMLPKYRWMGRFVNKPNPVTRILALVIPYHVRKNLRFRINTWNVSGFKDRPTMSSDTENDLRSRYQEDIAMLEEIVGRDLSSWRQAV